MFVLKSHIIIGAFTLNGVNDCRIKKGIHSYVDTAIIKVPTTARLKQKDTVTVSVDTANKFNRGDKVTIELGYNGKLKKEFVGFVSRVNYTTPCEIECEGYSYLIRKKNINKTFTKGTKIRAVCEELIKGTGITLSNAIPDIALGSALRVVNENGAKVLDYLKDNLKYSIYFNGSQLYVGLEETELKGTVKYKLGWNTIKDNGLKYHLAEDTKVKVILKTPNSSGGKTLYTVGDADGDVREHIVNNVASNNLKNIAENYLKQLKFNGYEGKLTAFLQPYCEHGYSAKIEDPKYPERNGTYFVSSVEISFGTGGARRIPEITKKLST